MDREPKSRIPREHPGWKLARDAQIGESIDVHFRAGRRPISGIVHAIIETKQKGNPVVILSYQSEVTQEIHSVRVAGGALVSRHIGIHPTLPTRR